MLISLQYLCTISLVITSYFKNGIFLLPSWLESTRFHDFTFILTWKWNIISFEHTSKNTCIVVSVTVFNYTCTYLQPVSPWINDSAVPHSGKGNSCSGLNTGEAFTAWLEEQVAFPIQVFVSIIILPTCYLCHSIVIAKMLGLKGHFDVLRN